MHADAAVKNKVAQSLGSFQLQRVALINKQLALATLKTTQFSMVATVATIFDHRDGPLFVHKMLARDWSGLPKKEEG